VTPLDLYAVAGLLLFAAGLWGVVARAHLFWKVFGVNIAASGVFMVLLAAPPRLDPAHADPVPQAMVLTGIVVAVAATAVALGMALRVTARTGAPFLEEDIPGGQAASAGSPDAGRPPPDPSS
jgi:multicomponent Na+:H+ antiporter subunit C